MKNKKNIYLLSGILIVLLAVAYFVTAERGTKTTTYKLEEKIIRVDSAKIDKIEIDFRNSRIVLQKSSGNWNVMQPVNYPASPVHVANALSTLQNYKISSKVSDNPGNKDRFGFNDTNYIKVSVSQDGQPAGSILIGKEGPGAGQTYVKKTEGNEIFLADDFVYTNIYKNDLTEWREKQIFSIIRSTVKEISLISKDDNITLKPDSTGKFYLGKDSVLTTVMDGVLNLIQNYNTQYFRDTTVSAQSVPDFTAKITANIIKELKFYKYIEDEKNPRYLLTVSDNKQVFDVDLNFVKMLFKTRKEFLGK
ncbi:MAG: DUF4340 domain-containing protein [Ignavibacteria bacterium]|jgi:hypothetical protein|nr:DUF4340 domain-containing protein [Ignavibacteria bacterium]